MNILNIYHQKFEKINLLEKLYIHISYFIKNKIHFVSLKLYPLNIRHKKHYPPQNPRKAIKPQDPYNSPPNPRIPRGIDTFHLPITFNRIVETTATPKTINGAPGFIPANAAVTLIALRSRDRVYVTRQIPGFSPTLSRA